MTRRGARSTESDVWALSDVSLSVNDGEILGIVGSNGAGKSTLLKILTRITEPTSGHGVVRGSVGSLLEVGTGFHPELTGRENVYLNGAILGLSRADIDRRFDEIVEFSGVRRFLETPVKRYSSGMYVRLAFAVAAHLDTDVLLIDEVLAVGDAAFQKKCLGRMSDIRSEGRTIVFVSHNMALVSSLCTRAVLLEAGRLVADGPVLDVVNRYQAGLSSQASYVDLAGWRDRYGARDVSQLTFIEMVDAQGRRTDAVPMGADVAFRIGVRFFDEVPAVELGLVIGTETGQLVTHLVSTWEAVEPSVQKGDYVYTVRIPRLLFVPGMYRVSPWVNRSGPGMPADDGVHGGLGFQVILADVNGNAPYFDLYSQPGETYVPTQWTVDRVDVSPSL